MKVYLVGGAVRDRLLGLPVRDRDWVVVGATEAEMLAQGYQRADSDFPVFLHPESGEEYALARRETKIAPGYKGFAIDAGPEVTLEQDLKRRDLTINAIAEDQQGQLTDPFDGQADLEAGLLRHISPAFVEDPLRLLRVARFAARLGRWGFHISHGTHKLMRQMAASAELETLSGERLWQETRQALAEEQPWRYFQVLQRCGALVQLLPALDRVMRQDKGHATDSVCPALTALERAVRCNADISVRFTATFYPAAAGGQALESAIGVLKVEKAALDLLQLTLRIAPAYHAAGAGDAVSILQLLDATRALHDHSTLDALLNAADALWPELAGNRALLLQARERVVGVTAASLQQQGLSGAELGEMLRRKRIDALTALVGRGG